MFARVSLIGTLSGLIISLFVSPHYVKNLLVCLILSNDRVGSLECFCHIPYLCSKYTYQLSMSHLTQMSKKTVTITITFEAFNARQKGH
jgi:hypothetical protein